MREPYDPMAPYSDDGQCISEFAPENGLGVVRCGKKVGHKKAHRFTATWTDKEEER